MTSGTGLRYSAAVFLGSALLFLIEFVSAKRLLPLLGGGAAVWTACLVFFQCALLFGYWGAHWLVTRLSPSAQARLYLTLVVLSIIQLASAIAADLRVMPTRPITSVIRVLTIMVGLPFLTLSATSPLLQAWYARDASDDRAYRLYAVSNIGSLLALLLYPLAFEPFLSLREQSVAVTVLFVLFALVTFTLSAGRHREISVVAADVIIAKGATRLAGSTVALWIALSTCGSLLLAAVTTYISQNIATIPLLWIAPLMAYLLSFVIAFTGERWLPREAVVGLAAVGFGVAYYLLSKGILSTPLLLAASGFCVSLFLVCLFLHAELYHRRPPEHQLTAFYAYVAIGGAAGAILVGVVAPSILNGSYELAFGLSLAALLAVITTWDLGVLPRIIAMAGTTGLASLIFTQVRTDGVNSLTRVRNFYGTLHVTQVRDAQLHATARTLYNGAISHGRQVFRADLAHAPTSYYGRISGVGHAIDLCCGARSRRIGVIGLGAGTIAAYGRSGDYIRFYDINPAVEDVARHAFTFIRGTQAVVDIIIGDARVSMADESPQRYDVIVVDAFSGDAIPVHLITLEALEVYKRHLAPGGIVAFHVSNRHLNLKPVVAQIAIRAGMRTAHIANQGDRTIDVWSSDWVLVTTNDAFLTAPAIVEAHQPITIPGSLRMWTDDYNSLLPIFKYRR